MKTLNLERAITIIAGALIAAIVVAYPIYSHDDGHGALGQRTTTAVTAASVSPQLPIAYQVASLQELTELQVTLSAYPVVPAAYRVNSVQPIPDYQLKIAHYDLAPESPAVLQPLTVQPSLPEYELFIAGYLPTTPGRGTPGDMADGFLAQTAIEDR